jgi:hypothetical protein
MNTPALDLFARARELPEAERDAFLADACGTDAELHLEARSLLADAARADGLCDDRDGVTPGAQDFGSSSSKHDNFLKNPG